ncbi:MAG: hypothetical protein HYY20_06905 [Candidatus Tectomicrobia bacterium]|uniref:Uncharacterized protein n=1 Tax=Tectimicrobiota bacterium TaxID=2528274 RepID=A0A932CNK0_UNCTE|nr:hypothetical protein [Candidatus Tectomicrobia bacterium]
MAKQSATLEELSLAAGISERGLRRRFQRKGTTFTGVKGGIAERSTPRVSENRRKFLYDLRSGDPYVVALNRKLTELKAHRNRLVTEKKNGWQNESRHLTILIEEYENLIEEW